MILNSYSEEEKEELFKKLKRIGELLSIRVSIEEDNRPNNSGAIIETKKVLIGLNNWDEIGITTINELTTNNIDTYHKISKTEYNDIPFVIKSFLHEISHLLTMNMNDCDKYREDLNANINTFMSYRESSEKYRLLPYEKLADNLAYKLLNDNYNSVIQILLGKNVKVKTNKVNKNRISALKMKQKYIN